MAGSSKPFETLRPDVEWGFPLSKIYKAHGFEWAPSHLMELLWNRASGFGW